MPADPPPRTISARWRVAAAAVTGAAVLAGASVLSWRDGYAAAVASRPMTDEDIAATCRERYIYSGPHLTGEPLQRFVTRDGDNQALVYVSEADNWMIVCRKDSLGVRTMGTQMEQTAKDRIQLFSAEDAVLKSNLVVGRVPKGTMTIQAQLASGRIVTDRTTAMSSSSGRPMTPFEAPSSRRLGRMVRSSRQLPRLRSSSHRPIAAGGSNSNINASRSPGTDKRCRRLVTFSGSGPDLMAKFFPQLRSRICDVPRANPITGYPRRRWQGRPLRIRPRRG